MARASCHAGSARIARNRLSASPKSALYRQRAASKCARRRLACPASTRRSNSNRKVGALLFFMRLLLSSMPVVVVSVSLCFDHSCGVGGCVSCALHAQERARGIRADPGLLAQARPADRLALRHYAPVRLTQPFLWRRFCRAGELALVGWARFRPGDRVIVLQESGSGPAADMRPAAQMRHGNAQPLGFQCGAGRFQAFLLTAVLVPVVAHKGPDDRFIDMRLPCQRLDGDREALPLQLGTGGGEALQLLLSPVRLLLARLFAL